MADYNDIYDNDMYINICIYIYILNIYIYVCIYEFHIIPPYWNVAPEWDSLLNKRKASPSYKVHIVGTDGQAKVSQGISKHNVNLFVGNNVGTVRYGWTFPTRSHYTNMD